MKQRFDFKKRPSFYDKKNDGMDKLDIAMYFAVSGIIFIVFCIIFVVLDSRFM